jgi:predicted metal-dependent peptidase
MHEMKEKLIRAGTGILNASKTELYVSMRFLDIALNSLDYEMDLSMKTIGTDSQKIRFNPRYLVENYQNDSVLVNRAYLHMILHCVFRHMFNQKDKDTDIWNLSCDIAVTAMIDQMDYRCIRLTVPDERQAMYDRMHGEMKVLTAEGIYQSLKKHPLTWLEMENAKKFFVVDDHVFWDSEKNENQDNEGSSENQNNQNEQNEDQHNDRDRQQKQDALEKQWQEISEKMRTNMETCSKDAADKAGSLYDYIKIATRERYDYRKFLSKFTTLREEIRLDLDSFDYIYYTYGLNHYGNMPLIEALEYKEVKKIEELAIVIDTSESCSGDYVRRFLEETFSILSDRENFFRKMNIHIIQCDAKAQVDDVITSEEDMKKYMENFRLIGFGGTDFRPAFEYVNDLCKKKVFRHLKGLLYFTDGYGVYPGRRPDYDVAFVFLEENYNDRQVPPWAVKLILGPDDIRMGGTENEY